MAVRLHLTAALGLAAIVSCAKKEDAAPFYAATECRRVSLIDAATGEAIIGAEDLAYDAAERRLILSAYDRRQVEKEARRGAASISEGGVYIAPIDALAGGATTVTVSSAVSDGDVKGGVRPHGVSFDPATREISFINRAYEKENGRWRMVARIEKISADGAADGGALRCSANDMATIGETTFVSFDHASCGWRGALEDVFGDKSSGVDIAAGKTAFDGVRHANGVAAMPDGRMALAATRDKKILILKEDAGTLTLENKIPVPGAPDNLTLDADGDIIAALYRSLLAIGAQRKFGFGRAGSLIVRIDPKDGAMTRLFEDRRGDLFTAASVAIETDGVLVVGSPLDRGLLVCVKDGKRDGGETL